MICTFEKDFCGFEVMGEQTDFIFERVQGKDVPNIEHDHNFDIEPYFVYAHDDSGLRSYTYLKSPVFEGANRTVECFQFWFYIGGFKVIIN